MVLTADPGCFCLRRISLADACGAQASLLLEYLACVAWRIVDVSTAAPYIASQKEDQHAENHP